MLVNYSSHIKLLRKRKGNPNHWLIKLPTVKDTMVIINAKSAESSDTWNERSSAPTEQIILKAELNVAKQELNYHQKRENISVRKTI